MTVYDTGRDLLEIGVIPLSDMLPETTIAKAMWVIANSSMWKIAKSSCNKILLMKCLIMYLIHKEYLKAL